MADENRGAGGQKADAPDADKNRKTSEAGNTAAETHPAGKNLNRRPGDDPSLAPESGDRKATGND